MACAATDRALPLLHPPDSCFSEQSDCIRVQRFSCSSEVPLKHLQACKPSLVNSWHVLHLTVPHAVSLFVYLPAESSLDLRRNHCFFLCNWPHHPAAVIVLITRQQHQSGHAASQSWRVKIRDKTRQDKRTIAATHSSQTSHALCCSWLPC